MVKIFTKLRQSKNNFKILTSHEKKNDFFLLGVEKLNDDCRRIHLHRSNKWDAPKDVLLLGKRLEHLSEYEREPRSYNKQGTEYWNVRIHESRAKRKKICTELPDDDLVAGDIRIDDIDNMTAEEIKAQLKDRGITTRLRSLKKLQQLFLKTLREQQISIASG